MSCAEQSLQTVSGVDPTVSVGDNSLLEALYGMSNIGWYNVEVSSANGGLDWYVTFVGVDCIGDMPLLAVSPSTGTATVSEFAKGTKNIAKLGMVSTHNFETAGSMNTADTFLGLDRVDVTLYKVSGHRHHVQFLTNLGDIPDFGTNADYLNGGSIVVSEAASGVLPLSETVTQLDTGIEYYFRVAAENAMGLGAWTSAEVKETPRGVPSAPVLVALDTSLHNDEVQTITTAATHIDEIQSIKTDATVIKEVQYVKTTKTSGTISGGGFALSYDGFSTSSEKMEVEISADGVVLVGGFELEYDGSEQTACIDFNADQSFVESELENLASITDVDVVKVDGKFVIQWNTPADPNALIVSDQACKAWVGGSNHAVTVTTTDTLGFDIDHDADASDMKTEL